MHRFPRFTLFLLITVSLFSGRSLAVAGDESRQPGVVGEAFGAPVTAEEFDYYYKTASFFTRLGPSDKPRSEDDIRKEAWQNLIYRHEAAEENITVTRQQLENELERLMSEHGIKYGTSDYRIWIAGNMNEEPGVFERRIEDLLIINKLLEKKTDIEVSVTEEEMLQKFLNQYNSFESEYIKFDNEAEAREFLKKVKANPRLWKDTYDEKKPLGQKGSAWINIMSLEALIDLWKIPRDDAYNILSHNEGDFIAAKFFYGDAVFRLLRKKEADMEKYDDKKKKYYRDTLTASKKRRIIKDYFDDLLKRASYRDYVAEERRTAKIEALKEKSLVDLKTDYGIITLKLWPDVAPKACENFITLVERGYYDGLIFHRVIKDFMIQTGDPTGTGRGGDSIWGRPFEDEVSDDVKFDRPGLLAMANAGANTNKSQFFITVKEAPHLDKRHTIFGEVIAGYDVAEKISNAETDSNNKPKKDIRIVKAGISKKKRRHKDD